MTQISEERINEQKLIEQDIEGFLTRHQAKELLRFVTVGSVDDGKSTLIGRLLFDTQQVYEDQVNAVKRASQKRETDIDYSLFTDGLKAEREQGITIDVAYRYFATEKRKFIIADTPGHVQYTRNMATGASTANVAVILIDSRLGVLQQSRRHAFIASLLGIPHLAVCVNKLDLVGFDQKVFETIREEFAAFTRQLGFKDVTFLPVSAKGGDNVVARSPNTPWYDGPTLLQYLETVPIAADRNFKDFRYPVQLVLRPNLDYRAFAGEVVSGIVKKGDAVMVLPSRKTSTIVAIDTFDGELEQANAPMSVAIRLADEVDVSRGDMLVHPTDVPRVTRRFDAMLVWLNERPLDLAKSYLIKHTTRYVRAQVERVAHTVDLESLSDVPAERMELNEIGRVTIACHQPLYLDAYKDNRSTGAFIIVDTLTNNTVAAGMVLANELEERRDGEGDDFTLRSQVSPAERAERLGQRGAAVLLRGANADVVRRLAFALERKLFDLGRVAYALDGASEAAASAVTARFVDAGLVAVVANAADGLAAAPARRLEVAIGGRATDGVSVSGATVDADVDVVVRALTERGLLGQH
jgi:sulfate adenylyltransferase large subunit